MPQRSEAYLPGDTRTARWQKNETLMAFGDEAKSAALVPRSRGGYLIIRTKLENGTSAPLSNRLLNLFHGDGSSILAEPGSRGLGRRHSINYS